MSSLTLGLLLPLISYIPVEETKLLPVITSQINEVYQSQIIAMEAYVSPVISSTQSTTETSSFNWMLMFQLIYFLGLAFAMFRLIKSSSKLFRLLSKSQTNKKSSHSEIVVSENILPFSFMKYIFIGNQDYNSDERSNILSHELYHVQSYHSIDVIFVELLKIIFWWHPMVYLYKKIIAENHEYAADEAVLAQSSRKQYCQLLMKATFQGVNLELTNPFFQTFIKKRITMMYQKESNKINLLKYSAALIAVVFMATIFVKPIAAQNDKSFKIASITGLEKREKGNIPNMIKTQGGKVLVLGKDYITNPVTGMTIILDDVIIRNGSILSSHVKSEVNDAQYPAKEDSLDEIKLQQKNMMNSSSNKGDCKVSEKGIYYNLKLTSRLTSCPEGEYGKWHAYPIFKEFATSHFNWPTQALEEGFTKHVLFNVVVDENGNMTEILEKNEEPYSFGIQEECHRIIDLMRDEFTFLPGECNGVPVKTAALFSMNLSIPDNKRHLVKIKDASTVTPKQELTIGRVDIWGNMGFNYRSNMNVAMSVELEDPDGEIIFKDSREFLYSFYGKTFQLSQNKNGIYTLRVTQDGQVKETIMDVTVF
ncbi:MAG: beta-lactamase regulating signal transducer with metallopeptidase domain [Halioglobus sp.]|jgi:beta-lactamase regulating signal transducer with metallopeptidase domain